MENMMKLTVRLTENKGRSEETNASKGHNEPEDNEGGVVRSKDSTNN